MNLFDTNPVIIEFITRIIILLILIKLVFICLKNSELNLLGNIITGGLGAYIATETITPDNIPLLDQIVYASSLYRNTDQIITGLLGVIFFLFVFKFLVKKKYSELYR